MSDQDKRPELPAIEGSEDVYGRAYIPLPGGWEIQTKGNGSTFRICDTKSGERFAVLEERTHAELERMAREVHAATIAYGAACEAYGRASVEVTEAMVEAYCVSAFADFGWPNDFTDYALARGRRAVRRSLVAALRAREG